MGNHGGMVNRKSPPLPPLTGPCTCSVPVRCYTNRDGGLLQQCLRCGAVSVVERRAGLPTVSKRRAAELTMFGPVGAP